MPSGYLAAEFLRAEIGYNTIELPLEVNSSNKEIVIRTVVQALLPTTDGEGYRGGNAAMTLGIYPGNNDDGIDGNEGIFVNCWSNGAAARPKEGMYVDPGPYYDIGFRAKTNGDYDILFNGEVIGSRTNYGTCNAPYWRLFGNRNLVNRGLFGNKKEWKYWENGELKMHLVPALSPDGAVCMYDLLNNKHYGVTYGTVGVGFNIEQARKLRLPATGGRLTVSLPTGYDADSAVVTALETARANGWTITVQTYEAEGVMTTDLFDIWVRKTQDENGAYVAQDDTRWQVDWCNCMYTPDGSTERDHGYESHPSVEEACNVWGLTPYIDPNAEELLLESQER